MSDIFSSVFGVVGLSTDPANMMRNMFILLALVAVIVLVVFLVKKFRKPKATAAPAKAVAAKQKFTLDDVKKLNPFA